MKTSHFYVYIEHYMHYGKFLFLIDVNMLYDVFQELKKNQLILCQM